MRLVLDTNVCVAIAIRPGPLAGAMRAAVEVDCVLLHSAETWAELVHVLGRPFGPGAGDPAAFLDWVRARGERVERPALVRACADPSDDMLLGLAVTGRADAIVTADRQVLALHPFCGIPIVRPKRFLDGRNPAPDAPFS
jgi:predicted nucleic acid-binding protein